jgi:hypothetical protein
MKKLYVVLFVIITVASGAYLFVRFHLLKAKDFEPDNAKASSPVDTRPAIIAKLQQLVKDGASGILKTVGLPASFGNRKY